MSVLKRVFAFLGIVASQQLTCMAIDEASVRSGHSLGAIECGNRVDNLLAPIEPVSCAHDAFHISRCEDIISRACWLAVPISPLHDSEKNPWVMHGIMLHCAMHSDPDVCGE